MRIARRFAVAMTALTICSMATVANALPFAGMVDSPDVDGSVVVTYDPADGALSMRANGLDGVTTFELKSNAEMFIPENIPVGLLAPPFDLATSAKIFKLNAAGFNELDLGLTLPAGLSGNMLMSDLDVNGSLLPSGGLENAQSGGPFLHVVPEPSSLALVLGGLLGILRFRRK